jgi:hypothetical protein
VSSKRESAFTSTSIAASSTASVATRGSGAGRRPRSTSAGRASRARSGCGVAGTAMRPTMPSRGATYSSFPARPVMLSTPELTSKTGERSGNDEGTVRERKTAILAQNQRVRERRGNGRGTVGERLLIIPNILILLLTKEWIRGPISKIRIRGLWKTRLPNPVRRDLSASRGTTNSRRRHWSACDRSASFRRTSRRPCGATSRPCSTTGRTSSGSWMSRTDGRRIRSESRSASSFTAPTSGRRTGGSSP